MKKRIAACLLAAALACGAVPAAAAPTYTDVPAGSWAAPYIAGATEAGLFQGVEENVFGMGQTMTRSQFVTTLCRLFGWEMVSPAEPSFSDCEPFRWYYAAVETALAEGAIPEYLSAFRPNDPITREEMASMLVRSLGYNALAGRMSGASLPFPDVKSNRGYIALAYDMGLITGHPDGTFQPDAPSTREQAAAVLMRAYEKLRAQSRQVDGAGYTLLTVETPEPAAESTVPTTPLEPLDSLYQVLREASRGGTDMSRAAVVFSAGGVATVTSGSAIQSSRAVSAEEVESYLRKSNVHTYYSTVYACSYLTYTAGSRTTTVWYQSPESLQAKLDLCRLFGVTHYVLEDL